MTTSNFISVASGSTIAVLVKGQEMIHSSSTPEPTEFLKVFMLGMIGGIGGYIGKLLIHRISLKIKQIKNGYK